MTYGLNRKIAKRITRRNLDNLFIIAKQMYGQAVKGGENVMRPIQPGQKIDITKFRFAVFDPIGKAEDSFTMIEWLADHGYGVNIISTMVEVYNVETEVRISQHILDDGPNSVLYRRELLVAVTARWLSAE